MVAKLQTNEPTMTSQSEGRGAVSGHMHSQSQKMEVGVVEVLTTEDNTNSLAPSRGIFVTEKTTCRDLVQMIINIDQLKGSPELYTLYEVDSNSRVGRQLAEDDRPLDRQRFWLDPHECFFQLRLNGEREKFRMRRAQSLENLADIRNFNQRLLSRKLSRKSRAPSEKSAWQMPPNNDVSKLPRDAAGNRGQMTNAMTKLKDSVSKLREHLDKFQRRKSMPAVPGIHCNRDPHIMTSENNGDGLTEQDESHNSLRHSHDGVQGFGVSKNVGDKLFHSLDDSRLSDSLPQDSSERSQTSAQTGEDTGAESSASRNESDAGPTSLRQQPNHTRQSSAAVLMRKKRRSRVDPDLLDLSSPDCQNTMTTRSSLQEFNSQLAARTSHLSSKSTKSRPVHSKETVRMRRRHSDALDDDDDGIVQTHRKVNQVEKRRSLQDVSSLLGAHIKHGAIYDVGLSSKDRETDTSSATSRYRVSSHASSVHSPGSTVSNASSKSTKPRRTLPQIPQTESDLEARKQRISTEAMSRVKLTRGGSQHTRQAKYWESRSPRKNETGSDEDDRESVKTLSGDGDSVFEDTEPALCYNVQKAGLVRPKPSKSTPHPKGRNRYVHASDATSSFKNTSLSPEDYTDCPDQYRDVPSESTNEEHHSTTQNGHSSHYSLQQIISDLRNAANSDYTPPMQSFSSASSQEPFEHAHGRKPEMGLDVSPLARPTPREDPSEYVDLQSSHPSLHRITTSYDLHTVVLENSEPGYVVDYGIDVYEASFIDCPSSGRALNGVAASPAGRRALIGRKRGAFRPVSTCGSMESGPMLSLVAVDSILDESVAANSGNLHEGDYIIEVNGMYVANSSAAVVMSEISKQQHVLQLLVARPKTKVATPVGDQEKSGAMLAMCKDKDKLQLKYNAIKMESEKSLDQMAELRLELQTKDTVISHLEEILAQRDSTLSNLEAKSLKKDKAVYEWQAEVEKRNMDIAHLETEVRQREERIAQLRKLLIQQSEVMQYGGVMGDDYDYNQLEYREEKVSAV